MGREEWTWSCLWQGAELAVPRSPRSPLGWEQLSCPPAGLHDQLVRPGTKSPLHNLIILHIRSAKKHIGIQGSQEGFLPQMSFILHDSADSSTRKRNRLRTAWIFSFPLNFFSCCFPSIVLLESSIWGWMPSVWNHVKKCNRKFKSNRVLLLISVLHLSTKRIEWWNVLLHFLRVNDAWKQCYTPIICYHQGLDIPVYIHENEYIFILYFYSWKMINL